jgi:hypothetical protein
MKAWMKKDDTVASKKSLFGMLSGKSKEDHKDDTFKYKTSKTDKSDITDKALKTGKPITLFIF